MAPIACTPAKTCGCRWSLKIGNLFGAKDHIPGGLRWRVVYKFACAGCNACYRKPTHTDRLLDQTSYNPTSHKATMVRTLTRRAQIFCDSDDSLTDEIKHLNTVFLLRTTRTQISSNAILTSDRTTALTTHTPLQPLYLTYGAPPKP